MPQVILSINAGSSSVKISVFKAEQIGQRPTELAVAELAGLTSPPATFSYSRGSEKVKKKKLNDDIKDQERAFQFLLDYLVNDKGLSDITERDHITHACHRVVHGGSYPDAHIIDPDTYHHFEELTDLAPLHNAGALSIVRACAKELPKTRNIAYFDSSFHATMPECIRTYPIDPEVAKTNKLRKYGFHGISYSFITRAVAEYLGKNQQNTSLIALHLGSGASACAIRNGCSLDNSMGLTPLEGLPGATRSGSVDPSLVFHYTHDAGKPSPYSSKDMHISTAEDILNKRSGWKALTGTADFGQIASSDDPKCRLAFDILVDRIVGYIGTYFVSLEGNVDALVFAGGIGEKSALLRATITQKCRCLGFYMDVTKNDSPANEVVADVGEQGHNPRILICRTDEQYEMARQCVTNPKVWN
ncbi:MAG: hypothetical protein M1836_003487 [Candelina mexicana]|nr:MAG: hypothetical protein M1836_003487 [Candelina mexicana]